MTTCIINSVEFQFEAAYQGTVAKWSPNLQDHFKVTLFTNLDNIPVKRTFDYYMGLGNRKDGKPRFCLESFMGCVLEDAWYGENYSEQDFVSEFGYSVKDSKSMHKACVKTLEKIINLFADKYEGMYEYLRELGY